MVHQVARVGFDTQATAYEAARPSYPPEAVEWISERLRIVPESRIVDLAAGTGKLTRLVEGRVRVMLAVEPLAGMRAELVRHCPRTRVLGATAECLPFPDSSLDGVTIAQAFHWFDAPAALAELRRTLRVGGGFALLWNARDRSVPWVDAVWSIMDRVEKRAPWRDHENWRDSAVLEPAGFTAAETAQFSHEHLLSREEVLQRMSSVSHVAVLPAHERTAVLDAVDTVLSSAPVADDDGRFAIPYRVDCIACRRAE